MDKTEQRLWQELLAHPAWEAFRVRILGPDKLEGDKVHRRSLKTQVQANLEAAGRKGDGVECARFAGQLEILKVVLAIPENELNMR